jgi:hypothetical protein
VPLSDVRAQKKAAAGELYCLLRKLDAAADRFFHPLALIARNPSRPLRAHLAVFPRESLRRLTVALDFEGCLLL